MRDGLRGFAEAHVIGEEAAEAVAGEMLQPVHAMALIGAQVDAEGFRDLDGDDFRLAAEALDIGFDGGRVLPARGEHVLEFEHGGGSTDGQDQRLLGGAAGGFDKVAHDGEQAADALGRELDDAAVLHAGDQLVADDLRRIDAAACQQMFEDGQQRVAHAVDLDAEFEREIALVGILDRDVDIADIIRELRAEIGVDAALPAERVELGHAHGDEMVPLRGGFRATEDHDALAAGGFAVGHAHLNEAVRAQHIQGGGLGGDVAADEGDVAGGFEADELGIVRAVHAHAAIVEIQGQHVDHALAAGIIRGLQAAQAQHRGGGTLMHGRTRLRRIGEDRRDLGGARAAAGRADAWGRRLVGAFLRRDDGVDQRFRRVLAQGGEALQRFQRGGGQMLALHLAAAAIALGEGDAAAMDDRRDRRRPFRAELVGAADGVALQGDIRHLREEPAAGEDSGVEHLLKIFSGIRHRHRLTPFIQICSAGFGLASIPKNGAKGCNSRSLGKGQGGR